MKTDRNIAANRPDLRTSPGYRTHESASAPSPAKPGGQSSTRAATAARSTENITADAGIATEATWLPENRQFTRSLTDSRATGSKPGPLNSLLEHHSPDRFAEVVRSRRQAVHPPIRTAHRYPSLPGRVAEVIWTEALPPNLPSSPVIRPDHRRSDVWRRVEKARNLLLNLHYSVEEIAVELGFASLDTFNRAFTKLIGESPRAYRSRLDGLR